MHKYTERGDEHFHGSKVVGGCIGRVRCCGCCLSSLLMLVTKNENVMVVEGQCQIKMIKYGRDGLLDQLNCGYIIIRC